MTIKKEVNEITKKIKKIDETVSKFTNEKREEFNRNFNMFGSNPTPQMIINSMMDLLMYEKNRNEVNLILKKMFTGDAEKDNQYFEEGCNLLKQLGEEDILENIGYEM